MLFLQLTTASWYTYRLLYGFPSGLGLQGILHHRQIAGKPALSFLAGALEYHWSHFYLHLSSRLEQGFVRGRPNGWQSRVFGMVFWRQSSAQILTELRLRYEYFWDWDGFFSAHQRLRPALFISHTTWRRIHLQCQIEPMYWLSHRCYAPWTVNQWRFFGMGTLRGARWTLRAGPALFYQVQPRETQLVLVLELQSRIKKPTAKSISPPDQTLH